MVSGPGAGIRSLEWIGPGRVDGLMVVALLVYFMQSDSEDVRKVSDILFFRQIYNPTPDAKQTRIYKHSGLPNQLCI